MDLTPAELELLRKAVEVYKDLASDTLRDEYLDEEERKGTNRLYDELAALEQKLQG